MTPTTNHRQNWQVALLAILSFLILPSAHAAPGDVDSLNANVVGGGVYATAMQPDGKMIIAGRFTKVLGLARNHIARLNTDGTLDVDFDPNVDSDVYSVAVQGDGQILLGGWFSTVGGAARTCIARVAANGTLDVGFDPKANGPVRSVVVQADGEILIGGQFTSLRPNGAVSPTARNYIARVYADGTLDVGFDPDASSDVYSVVIQADGQILLGGWFSTVTGITRNRIARMNADGTLDAGFDPNANSAVLSVAVQADGKILLGGFFSSLQPNGATATTGRSCIARLNADGTLDAAFNPKANNVVRSMSVQADGKILLGGDFTTLQPNGAVSTTNRNHIARLNAAGTLDAGFNPNANNAVSSVSVQADGKILLGGAFTTFQPNGAANTTTRNWFARLVNDPAMQSLSALDTTQAIWTRGGSAPDVSQVTFELSTDSGTTWTLLSNPNRMDITANWQLAGLNLLPASGQLRARGRTAGGSYNGSSDFMESVIGFSGLLPPSVTITAISPISGTILGDTRLTIIGTGFTGTTEVTIGGNPTTGFIVVNASTITATAPAGRAGSTSVLVTTPNGTNEVNALYTYIVPDISVAQSNQLFDGEGSVQFTSMLGNSSTPLTFTITNSGDDDLTSLVVTKDGADAADFSVSELSATDIPVGAGTATFTVTFHPSSGGAKAAALHIASNVIGGKNPFDIMLTGTGRNASQAAQVIAFNAPLKLYPAESPFTLGASTNSGLPVAFTVVSGPATVSGNVLTLTGAGVVKLRAAQSGAADFLVATPVERTITVAANPATLTLTNLNQTYTGTPLPIVVIGTTEAVDVTYKVGLNYVSTPPINVGSYPVKAVSGAITKTGVLIITKAPLFVTPDDQRKFAGQSNPVLGFSYSGFLGSDNAANSVSKSPAITTTATAASVGGLYPITASGGISANYLFVYMKGTMKIETFAASYEALLVDVGTQRPTGKLELTVAASSKTFTAKLTTPTEMAAVSLSGILMTNATNETATGTASVKRGLSTYLVNVTLPLKGNFTAEAKLNDVTLGTAADGRKLLSLTTGQTLSYIGAHSALLAPATAGAGVPAGAGWAVATIDAKGLLKLTGKLADGTGLTASLAADVSSNPGYRLFLQPYTPTRTGTFIAGGFALKPHPDLAGRRIVAFEDAADLTWVKAPRLLDTSYRAGFSPVSTRFTLDPWLPPTPANGIVPAIPLEHRLGLSGPANRFTSRYSAIITSSFFDLPTTLALNAMVYGVSVIAPLTAPMNTTKWKVTVTPTTGAFVGSFELTDAGKKRLVPFTGMMRQPPSTDPSGLIGDGHFLLPSLYVAPNNELLSGEIGFER